MRAEGASASGTDRSEAEPESTRSPQARRPRQIDRDNRKRIEFDRRRLQVAGGRGFSRSICRRCPNWNEAAKEMKKALILAAKTFLIGRTSSDVTELAKDVSQEWWMLAHSRLFRRYRPGEPLFPFAYEALRRLCLPNSRKKDGKEMSGLSYEPLDHRCNHPIRDERQRDMRRRIGHALWKLPEKEREAIVLRFYKDVSFVAVAKRQGCTTTALYLRLHHGLGKLRPGHGCQAKADCIDRVRHGAMGRRT
jgi:RNA polymerase sigma factor (sigma-70 family)